MAAATLSDLAYRDAAMQEAILEADGVPPLLHLLRNGSPLAQEHAARAIWHLCELTSNQQAVVDCGVIVELVALSKGGTAKAQQFAAAVISDLAKGAIEERERRTGRSSFAVGREKRRSSFVGMAPHEIREIMAEADAVAAEGEGAIGGGSEPRAAERAGVPPQAEGGGEAADGGSSAAEGGRGQEEDGDAAGLGSRDRLGAIAQAGGIGPLVGMVTNGAPEAKERAASALWHLSVDPANQVQITRAGGIAPIVTLLQDGTDESHEFAAGALDRLAKGNADNQVQIAKKLVTLLSPSMADGAQQRAAQQLWSLARGEAGATARVVNAGAISPLVALLGVGSAETKAAAEGALAYLARHDTSNQCGLAIASGLVQMLGGGSAEGQVSVVETLIKFVQMRETVGAISEAGIIEKLIGLMRTATATTLTGVGLRAQELAATVLLHLSRVSEGNVRKIASGGGVKPLIALACAESGEAQSQAAAALAQMARVSREMQSSIVRDGAVDPLLYMLDTGATGEAQANAADALWGLCDGNAEAQQAVVEAPIEEVTKATAVELLVRLLKFPSPDAQRKASGALTALAVGSAASQAAIVAAGAVAPLVALLEPEHGDAVHAQAAIALAELSKGHAANQGAIAEAGGIPPCVRLLMSNGDDEEAKAAAATALWCLSSCHAANQQAIAEMGGLAPLVALVGACRPATLQRASSALAALGLDHPANQTAISKMLVELLLAADGQSRPHTPTPGGLTDTHTHTRGRGRGRGQFSEAGVAEGQGRAPGGETGGESVGESVGAPVGAPGAARAPASSDSTGGGSGRVNAAANAANAIRSLARFHPSNQVALAQAGGIAPLVRFLMIETAKGTSPVEGAASSSDGPASMASNAPHGTAPAAAAAAAAATAAAAPTSAPVAPAAAPAPREPRA